MYSTLSCFRKDEQGASMIEFAFVLPLFLLIFMAVLEYATIFYLRGAIEEYTRNASRLAITGNTYDGGPSRGESLEARLRNQISAIVYNDDPSAVQISTRIFETFQSANPAGGSNFGTPTNFGTANQIIEYTVQYNHEFLTPLALIANRLFNSGGAEMPDRLTITSTAFAKNEDF